MEKEELSTIVENNEVQAVENEKNSKVRIVLKIVIPLLVAILSFTLISQKVSDPNTHKVLIETLDKKQTTVMALSAGTATLATAASLLLGERAEAVSTKLLDLTGYFLVILCAILLEKYLVTLLGLVVFKYVIPITCLLYIYSELQKDKVIKIFSIKVCIFAITAFFVIPISVNISNVIENTHKSYAKIDSIVQESNSVTKEMEELEKKDEEEEQRIKNERELREKEQREAEEKARLQKIEEEKRKELEEATENENEGIFNKIKRTAGNVGLFIKEKGSEAVAKVGGAKDTVVENAKNIGTKLVEGATYLIKAAGEIIKKATKILNDALEAIAVMMITTCVIPILVVFIYLWLVKLFFNIDFKVSFEKTPKLSGVVKNFISNTKKEK